jgi:hypothetical protein
MVSEEINKFGAKLFFSSFPGSIFIQHQTLHNGIIQDMQPNLQHRSLHPPIRLMAALHPRLVDRLQAKGKGGSWTK